MGETTAALVGPDLERGVSADTVLEGKPLLGHAFGEAVLIARQGAELFAVSATCPHYGGPLAEGLQVGGQLRCPWHHAAFDLRTGAVLRAPAINPLGCYALAHQGPSVKVTGKKAASPPEVAEGPSSVVIIGAGAAGHAAAETLRAEGYAGPVTLIGADPGDPCDRPNLSKDFLAGTAPEAWIALRSPEALAAQRIALSTGVRVTRIDPAQRVVALSDGTTVSWGALILATGAEALRPDLPGAELPHVQVLRTLEDCRAIIQRAATARHVVVLGASFIGLEVAASLRARGLEVQVVAPGTQPLERVLGPEVGAFFRALHEENGVRFHLGQRATAIDASRGVTLEGGAVLPADLVVAGVGVRPSVGLAEAAGLTMDRGIQVDALLQTSAPGIWAAGDIARWPDPHSGQSIRVEHWVVAQRQGQTAARNVLGKKERFEALPFFWTTQFGVTLNYVGHAPAWERIDVEGTLAARDCTVRYLAGGRTLAIASVGRDLDSLKAELALERERTRLP